MTGCRPTNLLLRAICAADESGELSAHLASEVLERGRVLYCPEDEIGPIWFPETGLISISSVMLSGDVVQTSLVGVEGGVGLLEACAEGVMFSQASVQAPGRFVRLPASVYCNARAASSRLRATVQEHFKLLVTEYRQTVACHARHRVENRLAWWLLEAQDRLGGELCIPLTQDILADILGVQRVRVLRDHGAVSPPLQGPAQLRLVPALVRFAPEADFSLWRQDRRRARCQVRVEPPRESLRRRRCPRCSVLMSPNHRGAWGPRGAWATRR